MSYVPNTIITTARQESNDLERESFKEVSGKVQLKGGISRYARRSCLMRIIRLNETLKETDQERFSKLDAGEKIETIKRSKWFDNSVNNSMLTLNQHTNVYVNFSGRFVYTDPLNMIV